MRADLEKHQSPGARQDVPVPAVWKRQAQRAAVFCPPVAVEVHDGGYLAVADALACRKRAG